MSTDLLPRLRLLLERAAGEPVHDLRIETRPLRGGLESAAVFAITARFRDAAGRSRLMHAVAKQLEGSGLRELAIYEALVAVHAAAIAPRVLATYVTPGGGLLLLENVRRTRAWPWSDTAHSAEVLQSVARLHEVPPTAVHLPPWSYDAELSRAAFETIEAIERNRSSAEAVRMLPALRRVGWNVATLRRQLVSGPLPAALLHGDLHSGNVVVRRPRAGGAPRIALIDWQRARVGSPLEDVSSFLQSLAYWEPQVRSRHDSLLGEYLQARGMDRRPTRELRDAYWVAAATNAFAGALEYHLAVAADETMPPPVRGRAAHAARDWLRIVRRADAVTRVGEARLRGRGTRGRNGPIASPTRGGVR